MESRIAARCAASNARIRTDWRPALALAALVLLIPPSAAAQSPVPRGLSAVAGAPPASEIALADVDGKPVRLSALRGSVVLVNFWATWCPPCRKEIPSLTRLQKLFKPEKLRVLAVNVGEDEETVFGFIPDPGFTILLDLKSASLRAWQVRSLPATFVVDPDGRVVLRAVGGREFDDPAIVAQLRELVRP
jgi:thiol-disulfide isomerase/thioredoxin